MRIPTREEFSPLPEVVDRFGLPDPLEVLSLLENQLEAVDASHARIRDVAAGLLSSADDLDAEVGAVTWHGEAADRFRAMNAQIAQSFRDAAENIEAAAGKLTELSQETKELIRKILYTIGVAATVVIAIIAAPAVTVALVVALVIYTLVSLIAIWLDEFLWLVQKIWDRINQIIEPLTPDGHPTPHPKPLPPPTLPTLPPPRHPRPWPRPQHPPTPPMDPS